FLVVNMINKFYFDRARYLVADVIGNEIIMAIDYKHARFRLIKLRLIESRAMQQLKVQAAVLAKDLINRKHNVNFSDTIRV
ncbi:MAG: hypothetical protein AAB685_02070, partial [Patescibacteria group bacterium]